MISFSRTSTSISSVLFAALTLISTAIVMVANPKHPVPTTSSTNVAQTAHGKIAFTSGRDAEGLEIYVMNPDGTGVTRLTRSPPPEPGTGRTIYNTSPAWSPDNTRIAFVSNLDNAGFEIYVMNADGTNIRRVTNNARDNDHPAWSPDGKRIAYASGFGATIQVISGPPPPPTEIFVVDLASGIQTQITRDGYDFYPTWSPDGSRIAFEGRRDNNNHDIYVMNADGTNVVRLTADPGFDTQPEWSPGGGRIAFASGRAGGRQCCGISGSLDLFLMNTDGSGVTRLTDDANYNNADPAWSPDGTTLAFTRNLINGVRFDSGEIYTIAINDRSMRALTNDSQTNVQPAWQRFNTVVPSQELTFTFDNRNDSVMENAGKATITVRRSGGRDGRGDLDRALSVRYLASLDILTPLGCPVPAIVGIPAKPGEDYIEARGELLFAIGEQTKTFDVQITDDTLTEAGSPTGTYPFARRTESILLSLDYSQHATPGNDRCYGAFGILEIVDDDLPPIESEFRAWRLANRSYAYVKLSLPDQTYLVRNWGTPVRSGNRFTTTIIAEPSPTLLPVLVRVPITTANIYDLGELAPGEYTFAARVTSGGETSERVYSFTVSAAPPAANPIDDARTFVAQHYRDFLGREPDEPGLNFWTSEITSCGTDAGCIDRKRVNTSGSFFLSQEFQMTGYYVYRLYKGSLGRAPRYVEFLPDVRKVAAGIVVDNRLSPDAINRNKESFAREFVERVEFRSAYGALSDDAFIDRLLRTTGGRLNADERQELLVELTSGGGTTMDRQARVLARVVDGIRAVPPANGGVGVDQVFETRYGRAFYEREFNAAFVLLEYFGYLRRDPDPEGYEFWLDKLNRFGNFTDAEMVRSFILAAEYRSRFGQP